MAKGGYIYIVSNKSRTVLYIGVTSNLYARSYEHKMGVGSAFTTKYNCTDLVYYEFFPTIEEAIAIEKRLKKWKRAWKDELIESVNPTLRDLFDEVSEMQ
jgi:putative endonuclease